MTLPVRPHRDDILRLAASGRPQEAAQRIEALRRANPNDPEPPTLQGELLAGAGHLQHAVSAFGQALRLNPDYAPALHGRAAAKLALADVEAARADFDRLVALDPGDADALAQLADLAARRGDTVDARELAARAQAADPGNPVAALVTASALITERAFDGAAQVLHAVLAGSRLTPLNRAIANSLLGDALDGLKRHAEAFEAYRRANDQLARLYAPMLARAEKDSALGHARRVAAWFERLPAGPWAPPAPAAQGPARVHVFLVGFPRSGTTLLEQVLAGHPDVVALEEKGTLEDAVRTWFVDDAGLERLRRAGEAELAPLREAYWRRVKAYGAEVAGKVFIDKMPLNTVLLPVIERLFPDARILFAVRDPRDVALSAFRRRFGMNPAMYQLLTLEGAARYYDAVMGLAELYRTRLTLNLREVRYERLVEDFEAEAKALAAFVGVDWTPAMADFAATARARPVSTPSSRQVSRGLYREGMAQWRPYAEALAPVLPLLDPWVERFGYPP